MTSLRRRAEAMLAQVRRAGMREVRNIEKQMAKLRRERQGLLSELGIRSDEGKRPNSAPKGASPRRRVDWERVFPKLPKGTFKAGDLKAIVPGVASGTVSLRLARWVKEKKLRRSGTRRGTRYTRVA
jgi:hypothetical protein